MEVAMLCCIILLLAMAGVESRSVMEEVPLRAKREDRSGNFSCMAEWLQISLDVSATSSASVVTQLKDTFRPVDEQNALSHRNSLVLQSITGGKLNADRLLDCISKRSSSCRSQAPCLNGGQCLFEYNAVTGHRLYRCTCMAGYTGDRCQTSIASCSSNPCKNGGSCVPDDEGGYRCHCSTLYEGDNCELEWLSKKKLQALTSSNAVLAREVQDLKSQLNDARRSDWHRTQRFLETLKTNITSKIDSLAGRCVGIAHYGYETFSPLNSNLDQGVLLSFLYVKKRSDTILRITGNFNHRVWGGSRTCSMWRFEIDGQSCSDPKPIAAVAMAYSPQFSDIPTQVLLTGFCRASAAGVIRPGQHEISLSVGPCISGDARGNAYTGWQTTSTFIVEEYCV